MLHLQIWCAAGVNLTGGRTADGGSIVGASIFYSSTSSAPSSPRPIEGATAAASGDEVDRLDAQLRVSYIYSIYSVVSEQASF